MTDETEQDGKMNCGLSVDERAVLQSGLAALVDTVPPRAVWQRIEEQARAEGLFGRRLHAGAQWLAGAGIAAAVMLAVLNLPTQTPTTSSDPEAFASTPDPSVADSAGGPAKLSALMVRSRQLERDLRSLPGQPSLMRASTAATIAEIEDRISAIDYRLNHPYIRLTPVETEIYWRERVRLMNSLVNLRRAQVQQQAF